MMRVSSHLRNLSKALLALVVLTQIVIVWISVGFFVKEDFIIGLPLADSPDDVQVVNLAEAPAYSRTGVALLLCISQALWLLALSGLIRFGWGCHGGEVLGASSLGGLRVFGAGMFLSAIVESLHVPLVLVHLNPSGFIKPVPSPWQYIDGSGSLLSLIGSLLVLIIASLLSEARRLQEEAELTI